MRLPKIMVAPNGARMQKSDHPEVPITQDETVACARACFVAGAGAIHAHIRDAEGRHLLDAAAYRFLVAALQDAVPDMMVQITTEAAGRYAPDHQMQVALSSGAKYVSVSIREIAGAKAEEVRGFLDACRAEDIALQFILYDRDDAALLAATLSAEELQNPDLQLLFVLGRYGITEAVPEDIDPFMDWMKAHKIKPDWAVCAFGQNEPKCLQKAVTFGGKCRTGFENSIHLADGSVSANNAEKVRDLAVIS